jgi:hypothetical protein
MAMTAPERAAATAVTKRLAQLQGLPEDDLQVIQWGRLLSRAALHAARHAGAGKTPAGAIPGP